MRFPSTIYANSVIPNGFYWMKLTNIITDPCGMERPRLWVQVEIGPMHELAAGLRLCVIIHPTDKADFIFANFVKAFRIQGCDFDAAIGRWASGKVEAAEYQQTKYSAVIFTQQPPVIRTTALRLERAEAEGQLDEVSMEGAVADGRRF